MDGLAVIGFIFGLAALGKVLWLEKQLKIKGILAEAYKAD